MSMAARVTVNVSLASSKLVGGRNVFDPLFIIQSLNNTAGAGVGGTNLAKSFRVTGSVATDGDAAVYPFHDGALHDSFGDDVVWRYFHGLYIKNTSATGVFTIDSTVGSSALFLPASPIRVGPGEVFMKSVGFDNQYPITSGASTITITPTTAAAATYELVAWGTTFTA